MQPLPITRRLKVKIDIYQTHRRNTFLAVRSGTPVPPGWVTRYWKTLDLEIDRLRTGMDVEEVVADIQRQGWSAFGASVEVKVVG